MGLADIGGFGQGYLKGQDRALSRYASVHEMEMKRNAEERARQQQALQSLVHGSKLSTDYPDVAEMAAREPDRYGLSPETVGPGVAQARTQRDAQARLNRALSTGDLDSIMNDPDASRLISEKHLPMIKEMQDRKKVDAIISGPGTPQQKAQALVALGAKVDSGMLEKAYPEFGGVAAEQTAAGTARGQMPLAGALAEAKAVGQGRGELQTVGPLAQAKKEGELRGELSPDLGVGVPPGGTSARRLSLERETPAQAEGRRRGNNITITAKDVSASLGRNRTQARAEVEQHIRNSSPVFKTYPPMDQAQILDYYTAVKQNKMMEQDPVMHGQPIPQVPPKPESVVRFEAEGQPGPGWFSWLFGESQDVPAISTPPRTLRTPSPAAPTQGGWGKAEVVR